MPSPNSLIIAPSILGGNHANLAQSAKEAEMVGLEWIHLDIMDGHFVPNLTFGPQMLKDLRKTCKLFFDTHLMLEHPENFIDAFADAGADQITIHVEPDYPLVPTLKKVRQKGCRVGIALNPKTRAEEVKPYIDQVDTVLAMTVQPGFGGQSFDEEVLTKIKTLALWRSERKLGFRLEVDGGVDEATGRECIRMGADTLVTGSAFFKALDKKAFVKALTPSE